jgi:hypothetical protein
LQKVTKDYDYLVVVVVGVVVGGCCRTAKSGLACLLPNMTVSIQYIVSEQKCLNLTCDVGCVLMRLVFNEGFQESFYP